jgi:hypothetical protein
MVTRPKMMSGIQKTLGISFVDWRTLAANLKATFPLSATNENATYNWEVGTIQRPNAQTRQFEVASHRWIDHTDKSGSYGTMLLTDCKNGSDKPNDNTLRLTLVRSPGIKLGRDGHSQGFTAQAIQDWRHHEIVFGLAGHPGDWRQGQMDWQAYRLNDPIIAVSTEKHNGALGGGFSLLRLNNSAVRVLALKKLRTATRSSFAWWNSTARMLLMFRAGYVGISLFDRRAGGEPTPSGDVLLEPRIVRRVILLHQAIPVGPGPVEDVMRILLEVIEVDNHCLVQVLADDLRIVPFPLGVQVSVQPHVQSWHFGDVGGLHRLRGRRRQRGACNERGNRADPQGRHKTFADH